MFSSPMIITGGRFTQNQHIDNRLFYGGKDGFERLEAATAPAAFHNSGERFDPPRCHPKTRVKVLEKIMDWILGRDLETQDALIMWLFGPAGAGKSAIAQTIAELCYTQGILLASFFFSRQDPTRNHERSIIATIAYQLCCNIPDLREYIVAAIDRDPLVFTRAISEQMTSLILGPLERLSDINLSKSSPRSLVIIDGLDECQNRRAQVEIIDVFVKASVEHKLPFIVFFASRPEYDISNKFKSNSVFDILTFLPLDDRYDHDQDIELLLNDSFAQMKQTHPFRSYIPDGWPSDDVVKSLVAKSSGQFIYASTVIKFVESPRHRPPARLEIALGTHPEGARRDMPFAELDALYTHILSSDTVDTPAVLRILGLIFLGPNSTERSTEFLNSFFSPMERSVEELFCDLASLVAINPYIFDKGGLECEHASLGDFLLDQSRSKALCVDPSVRRKEYVLRCFQRLTSRRPITCGLTAEMRLLTHFLTEIQYDEDIRASFRDFLELVFSTFDPAVSADTFETGIFLGSFLPQMLTCVEHQKSQELELYTFLQQKIDQILIQQIPVYFLHNRLTLLVVLCGNTVFPGRRGYSSRQQEARAILLPLESTELAIDRSALDLLDRVFREPLHYYSSSAGTYPVFGWNFSDIVRVFLNDAKRSGRYALDDARYADAALFFLKYLGSFFSQKSPKYNSRERRMRLKTPWLWRKQIIRHGTFRMQHTKIEEMKRRGRRSDWCGTQSPVFENPEITAIRWALEALPFLLNQSGESDALVNLARRRGFPKRALIFPRRLYRVKEAIENYLMRVSEVKPRHSSHPAYITPVSTPTSHLFLCLLVFVILIFALFS